MVVPGINSAGQPGLQHAPALRLLLEKADSKNKLPPDMTWQEAVNRSDLLMLQDDVPIMKVPFTRDNY